MSRLLKMLSKGKEKVEDSAESSEELNNHIIHHELRIPEIESQLNKWTLPKLEISSLYKTKMTDIFKGEYVIKTVEKEIDIKQTQESIPLISKQLITEHIKDYKYLHIGSIQIAIKPLFRQGIDTPCLPFLEIIDQNF